MFDLPVLADEDWTQRQRQYMSWVACPKPLRPKELRNEEQVAHSLGVTVAEMRSWQLLPGFWDEVFAIARGIIGEALPDILTAIVSRAVGGSVAAQKLALEVLGVHHDRIEHDVTVTRRNDQLVILVPSESLPPAAEKHFPSPQEVDRGNRKLPPPEEKEDDLRIIEGAPLRSRLVD